MGHTIILVDEYNFKNHPHGKMKPPIVVMEL
jgi:hypothetical protein